jgi:hypothetical protein
MPRGLHVLLPWGYRVGLEKALRNPDAWGWLPPRPLQWTVWFIGVFIVIAIGAPRALEARWQHRAPTLAWVVDPLRVTGYRATPGRCWDDAAGERAVRWACRLFATRVAWTLGTLNALALYARASFAAWECGGHWGCQLPPPSDYLPLLMAAFALTLACLPTRRRVLRVLQIDQSQD